jgi:hypothetical protein
VQAVYDARFSRVMQTMDDPSIPLEQKWPAIAQECSRKEEFRWDSCFRFPQSNPKLDKQCAAEKYYISVACQYLSSCRA